MTESAIRALLQLVWLVTAVAFPFAAMVLMWRRMKRVRSHVYQEADAPRHETAWEETLTGRDGLSLDKRHNPNDDLIALGAKEKQAGWTISNQ